MNFDETKKEYNEIICSHNEIGTQDKLSGIYMIYIENIDSIDYIPMYIGQSKNMYNRRGKHRGYIKELYELENKKYNESIPMYSGKYLYCKLVSVLKNNNKTRDDVKFKVIEYCDENDLDERERFWINKLSSNIYGFNQFQEIVDSNELMAEIAYSENKNWNNIALKGIELLKQFDKKIKNYDEQLEKYKYYKLNYSLLLGNYNSLYNLLEKVSIDYFVEIDDEILTKFDRTLERFHGKVNKEFREFIESGKIVDKIEMCEILSIK